MSEASEVQLKTLSPNQKHKTVAYDLIGQCRQVSSNSRQTSHSTAGLFATHTRATTLRQEAIEYTSYLMLFTPPFVEGWRSKLRLQNRKAWVLAVQPHYCANIIPNSSSQGRPRKESPVEYYGPRFKVCVFHGTQDFTRHPPVNYLPPKGNRQTLSTTQVGTFRSLSVFITWVFWFGLSCGRYSVLNADAVTASRSKLLNSTL